MHVIAIYNPVCGDGTAKARLESYFEEEVLPLCEQSSIFLSNVLSTERADHAGELALQILKQIPANEFLTIILGSGDGTLHEIINVLSNAGLGESTRAGNVLPVHFVLVPCGSANALYSSLFPPDSSSNRSDGSSTEYRLQSLRSFFKGPDSHLSPLTLAITTLFPPPTATPKAIASAVVVSTCLHASILNHSERLRAQMPGIERFKVAAKQNRTRWYYGNAKLLPVASLGEIQSYDPDTKEFIHHSEEALKGPFLYFLSTINVDRLEPHFRITPLAKTSASTCDLVVIRPFSDPTMSTDSPETRETFAIKLWDTLQAVYQDGNHINLRYDEEGRVSTEGEGPFVVEYIRCGGWEWIPDDIDDDAHLLCLDGFISTIEKGGRAVCVVATPQPKAGFMVYV
ncbi:hypothetical protein J3R30DRAFT_3791375 [Lentinula aciculospora]|uniref:DAGKc domain-containing protein n=1 Tax=Lentinula aciculospora TaxID=153920 RepID=A0A9W9DW89_9AGAR|nr:hypothetical protein J3R30DRAFT_3791375 [Lentinula aciculospora]